MKKLLLVICSAVLAASLLSACQRQDEGMVAGGVVGGVAGSALTGGSALGTGIGVLGGAVVGRSLAN
jgi:osmotically inducible lipoprotein OsmB